MLRYEQLKIIYNSLSEENAPTSVIYSNNQHCKCYDNIDTIKNKNSVLSKLINISDLYLRDIYTEEYVNINAFTIEELDTNLFLIEDNKYCVHKRLRTVFCYLMANEIQYGIAQFLNLIKKINKEKKKSVKIYNINSSNEIVGKKDINSTSNDRYLDIHITTWSEYKEDFKNIKDNLAVMDFIARVNNNLFRKNNLNIEVYVDRIRKILNNLKRIELEQILEMLHL